MIGAEQRSEWRTGWRSLAGATTGMSSGVVAYTYSAGLFIKPIEAAEHWSRAQIAFGQTLVMLSMALVIPLAGLVTDRAGPRIVGVAGLLSYAAACFLISVFPISLYSYYGLLILIALTGAFTTGVVFGPAIVANFNRWRGVTLALMLSGPALFAIPLSPLIQYAISVSGWRAGYGVVGLLPLVVGVPCVLLLIRRWSHPANVSDRDTSAVSPGFSCRAVARSAAYWKIFIGTLLATLALGGFLNQLPALLSDLGLSSSAVAGLMSLFLAMVVVGRVAVGFLLDRMDPPLVTLLVTLCAAVVPWLFLMPTPSLVVCGIAVVFLGSAMGAESDIPAFFCARYFGLNGFGTIYGTIGVVSALGFGVGALIFGALFVRFHDYSIAMLVGSGLFLVAGLFYFSLRMEQPADS